MEPKTRTEIKTFYGNCSCCLQHGYMKSMWQEYQWNGKIEVYAQMLMECFGLEVWYSKGNDNICNSCILNLRAACAYKDVVKDTQINMRQKSFIGCKIKKILQRDIYKLIKRGPPSPPVVVQVEQEAAAETEPDYKIEYLEEDILEEEKDTAKEDPSNLDNADCNSETSEKSEIVVQNVYALVKIEEEIPRKRKPRQSQTAIEGQSHTEIEGENGTPSKYPKKLPKHERHKTYRQYTTDDLRDSLEAVKTNKLSMKEASELYGVPQKTIAHKVRAGITEEENLSPSVPREFVGDIKTLLIYTNITPFKTRFNNFLCAFCSAENQTYYYKAHDLRKHTEISHPDRFHRVEFILRPFSNNNMLKVDIYDLKCNMCDLPTLGWSDMLDHLEKQHNLQFTMARKNIIPYILNDNSINCAICHESFTTFMSVDSHMNTHYLNYTCSHCGETFATSIKLKSHEKIHGIGQHRCPVCKKKFLSESNKNRHFKYHHGGQIMTFKCNYCNDKFQTEGLRDKHAFELHSEYLKVITCEICGAIFYFDRAYQKHKRRRHNNANKCTKCDKTFDTPKLLDKHKLKDKCVKSYKCDICHKLYLTDRTLKAHVKIYHNDESMLSQD